MEHSEVEMRDLVEHYVGGSLTGKDQARFEDHLIACTACQDAVALATDLREGLADVVSENEGGNRSHRSDRGDGTG